MKKNLALIIAFLFASLLQAQPIDYDNLAKEYQDVAIRALAGIKPSTKKWVEETALKHPAGKFDTTWVKGQVAGLLGGWISEAGIWGVMIAYQKMLNKEAREERKISKTDAALELKIKESKIALDNKAIEQQKQESRERYDNSMQAANTQSGMAVVSSSTQVNNSKLQVKQDSLKQRTATAENKQKQKTNAAAEKDKQAADASRDHKKAMQDNIKKLLDQLAELQRSARF